MKLLKRLVKSNCTLYKQYKNNNIYYNYNGNQRAISK